MFQPDALVFFRVKVQSIWSKRRQGSNPVVKVVLEKPLLIPELAEKPSLHVKLYLNWHVCLFTITYVAACDFMHVVAPQTAVYHKVQSSLPEIPTLETKCLCAECMHLLLVQVA